MNTIPKFKSLQPLQKEKSTEESENTTFDFGMYTKNIAIHYE